MADEEFEDNEFEGDAVVWCRIVMRGLEGGLRETVAASEARFFKRGQVVTMAVDAVVDYVAFPAHKPLDDEDDDEGVDRLHITKLETAAIIDRSKVAADLDAQAQRNAEARTEREQAREAKKQAKKDARKAAREQAKAEAPPGGVDGAVSLFGAADEDEGEPGDVTDAERAAMAMAVVG